MRSIALALLLPLAACASAPEATQTAALDANGPAGPAAAEPATEAKTKEVCWTEIVSGTRSRKQKVCRTERSERNGEQSRDALKDFQDRAGGAGPPAIMGGG